MEYRQLGNTGLKVSTIGFGASPLGNVFRTTDPNEGLRAVHLAIDNGINFFDVSPYYGHTLAEKRLGDALAGKRKEVILATKCGRYGEDRFDFSADRVMHSIEESLERLQTDYVDLLQVHDVEFGNIDQIIHETLPALRRIQEQGKARYIGVTGYPLGMLARIMEAVPVDTVLSYCRYNLMITDMDDILLPVAKKRDVGLINASGLHMGILTQRGAPSWHPAPANVQEYGKKVVALCGDRGIDISETALRFCLDHPYVSSTLVGVSTTQHVKENLAMMRAATDYELVQEIRTVLGPVLNTVWPSGLAENHDAAMAHAD